jgi:hypothetical protein
MPFANTTQLVQAAIIIAIFKATKDFATTTSVSLLEIISETRWSEHEHLSYVRGLCFVESESIAHRD